jgi:hypothetical protein
MAHAESCAGQGPPPTTAKKPVHDLLDTLKQCVESNAATYFPLRITYEN